MATTQLETSLLKVILKSDKPISDPLKQFVKRLSQVHTGKVSHGKDLWQDATADKIISLRLSMPYSRTVKGEKQEYTLTYDLVHFSSYSPTSRDVIKIGLRRVTLKNEKSYHENDPWLSTYRYEVNLSFDKNKFDELSDMNFDKTIKQVFKNAMMAYEESDKKRIKYEKQLERIKTKRETMKQNLFTAYGLKDNKIANEAFEMAVAYTRYHDPSKSEVEYYFKQFAYFLKANPDAEDPVEQLTESK